jgi:hypothetical protein
MFGRNRLSLCLTEEKKYQDNKYEEKTKKKISGICENNHQQKNIIIIYIMFQ